MCGKKCLRGRRSQIKPSSTSSRLNPRPLKGINTQGYDSVNAERIAVSRQKVVKLCPDALGLVCSWPELDVNRDFGYRGVKPQTATLRHEFKL